MRIHFVTQGYAGLFAADLAEHWAAAGHDVVVFTSEPPVPPPSSATTESRTTDREPRHQPPTIVGGIPMAYDPRNLAGRLLSRLTFRTNSARARQDHALRNGEADVVLSIGAWPEGMIPGRPRAGRPRFLLWLYDLFPDTLRALAPESRALRVLAGPAMAAFSSALDLADDVVAISAAMATRARSRLRRARVHTIPLWAPRGVDLDVGERPAGSGARGPLVALYQGNLGLAYDFDVILDAASLTTEAVSFRLAGQGGQRPNIARRIEVEGLTNVALTDWVAPRRLRRALAEADVHLLPLRPGWNGAAFPSKVLASLALGRPVIVTGDRESEVSNLVERASCGVVLPADAASLADALRSLATNPGRLIALGEAGKRLYRERFQASAAFAAWDELLAGAT